MRSFGLSRSEQAEVWERRSAGESLQAVARAVNRHPWSLGLFLASTGGCRAPVPRRSTRGLSAGEREEISRGLAQGASCRVIATRLERSPSTVSREVARNGGRRRYRAGRADQAAYARARRPKPAKLALQPRLRGVVEEKLGLKWSPQQIAAWLKLEYPDEAEMRVSHETIYLSLYVQSRGALRRELASQLRSGRGPTP